MTADPSTYAGDSSPAIPICDDLSAVKTGPFSDAVAQLQSLFNNCGALAFLLGAGCSSCAGLPLTKELTHKVRESSELNCTSRNILNAVESIFAQAPGAHIEDYLSDIVDQLAIADRRSQRGVGTGTISVYGTDYKPEQLRNASDQIKHAIACAVQQPATLATHRDFVTAVHQPARVGRPARAQPIDYLVLNYDTIVEDALALTRIPYADGLYGGSTAWWDPTTFDRDGLSARIIKLHGSVDWYQVADDPMPRRVRSGLDLSSPVNMPLLIWPSSTKYQETQLDPFAQLLDRARQAMRPNDGEQRLLIISGYSFGDDHINREIEKAIRESSENLTVAAFTESSRPSGALETWRQDASIRSQLLIFTSAGFFHDDTTATSDIHLNWWKFENLTSILTGAP